MLFMEALVEDKKAGATHAVPIPELVRRRSLVMANQIGLPVSWQLGDGFDYLAILDVPSQPLDDDDYTPERWLIELREDGLWAVYDAGDSDGAGGDVVVATLTEALERVQRARREAIRDARQTRTG
ncbi:hypothetical protein [Acidiphilium sp.]|uniref:hypothetical protein n=1 Tax=Acidiphilium sp. TaxID=527 RepID=UPI00258BD5E3|nr:hypothetical protein [Acidiphilium sp.]